MSSQAYVVRRPGRSRFITLRGLQHHVLEWGDASLATPERPSLLMQHGWMDVAASFQFVVDALAADRHVLAFDWRGFGLSDPTPGDTYWVPDYVGDLDAALDVLFGEDADARQIDLLGHSMGANIVMVYAGLRPARIRRLVNLEGFGLPASTPSEAPERFVQWLDGLKRAPSLRDYASMDEVAERLRETNPRLAPERALWLAQHWSRQRSHDDNDNDNDNGNDSAGDRNDDRPARFELLADALHKRQTPLLYQHLEALECWKRITAPVLWVEGDVSDTSRWMGRYTKADFHERLNVVPDVERAVLSPAGHMVHHDQPEALASRLEAFLGA